MLAFFQTPHKLNFLVYLITVKISKISMRMATSLFRSALKGGLPKTYLRKTIRASFNLEQILCIHSTSFLNGNITII